MYPLENTVIENHSSITHAQTSTNCLNVLLIKTYTTAYKIGIVKFSTGMRTYKLYFNKNVNTTIIRDQCTASKYGHLVALFPTLYNVFNQLHTAYQAAHAVIQQHA